MSSTIPLHLVVEIGFLPEAEPHQFSKTSWPMSPRESRLCHHIWVFTWVANTDCTLTLCILSFWAPPRQDSKQLLSRPVSQAHAIHGETVLNQCLAGPTPAEQSGLRHRALLRIFGASEDTEGSSSSGTCGDTSHMWSGSLS